MLDNVVSCIAVTMLRQSVDAVDAINCSVLSCRTEMNVLQKVHHPHTVQFFGAVTKQTPYMIVTEFMSCGSMADMFRCGLGLGFKLWVRFLGCSIT